LTQAKKFFDKRFVDLRSQELCAAGSAASLSPEPGDVRFTDIVKAALSLLQRAWKLERMRALELTAVTAMHLQWSAPAPQCDSFSS
jgi:hypothetical protein